MYERRQGILKYDLLTQEMSAITVSVTARGRHTVLMTTEDGRLGFATVSESRLYLWSREQGPNGDAGWAQSRVNDLDVLIQPQSSTQDLFATSRPAGFADNGAGGVVFIWTTAGFFTIDLKSSRANKVGESRRFEGSSVVPYMSFCIPGTDFSDRVLLLLFVKTSLG